MPKILLDCDEDADVLDAIKMLSALTEKHHPGLAEAGVTIQVFTIQERTNEGDVVDGPCLELHGYPAAATIKINSYKSRKEGACDATLTIDKHTWGNLEDAEQAALLDHELQHLRVIEKKGFVQVDDCGRPKLKLRLHDFQLGGFSVIVQRYGDKAIEAQQVQRVVTVWKQGNLFNVG